MSNIVLCPDCKNMSNCPILKMSDGIMKCNHCYSFKQKNHYEQFVADIDVVIDIGKQQFDFEAKLNKMNSEDRAKIIVIDKI